MNAAKEKYRMKDKICVVTGANVGIGKVTALELAGMGATVVMVCRNREKGEAAAVEIVSATGNKSVHLLVGDLSSQKEVRDMAARFKERFDSLHVLVNNAGGLVPTRQLSADGIEKTFATNHLGYFLLTNLLLDLLVRSAPSRIVNVSSDVHRLARLDFDNLQGERKYAQFQAYALSKLANVLFTYELAQRLDGKKVTVNGLHPGGVNSNFYNNSGKGLRFFSDFFGWTMRSPEKGAETVIYLASSPEVEGITGKYFKDKKAIPSSKLSMDGENARRLWEVSEEMVKLKQ
ncbi:MAG TPA: SDR family oxidoreductase [Candidatus Kryptobacter bacterium]|nr:SDR family oxidoreductase [Candidatus Kryptobacter bacterium]